MKNIKSSLREKFLKEFIKTLLLKKIQEQKEKEHREMVSVPPLIIPKRPEQITMPPKVIRKKTILKHPIIKKPAPAPVKEEKPISPKPVQPVQPKSPEQQIQPVQPKSPEQQTQPVQSEQSEKQPPTYPLQTQKREPVTLADIEKFLTDPAVLSVECTGPGKPLLVNRSGKIQATTLILTQEEIKNIMSEISERTRIPLAQGIFKATLGNYTVTAVISEFAGTRFIIQKRYYSPRL